LQHIAVYLYRATGAGLAIALMEILARAAEEPLSRVPFVTSIMLVMALPESEPARTYNVVAGHMLSCVAGLLALWTLGAGDVASAVALGLALFFMLFLRAIHPPAGINAFLIASYGLTLKWTISPVLIGSLFLVGYKRMWWIMEERMRASDTFKRLPDGPNWSDDSLQAFLNWRPYRKKRKASDT
jgi:CBS-domain-containing membrane protein